MSRTRHRHRPTKRAGIKLPPLHTTFARGRRMVVDAVKVEKHWMAGCRGKRRYDSQRMADRAIAEVEAATGVPMMSYSCTFCGALHLATDRPEERRRLRRLIHRLENHLRERGVLR